jgi:hypothetical protein
MKLILAILMIGCAMAQTPIAGPALSGGGGGGADCTNNCTFTGVTTIANGTSTVPSLQFAGSATTGLSQGGNQLYIVAGGALSAYFDATYQVFNGNQSFGGTTITLNSGAGTNFPMTSSGGKWGLGAGATSPSYFMTVIPTANVTASQTFFLQDGTASTGKTGAVIKAGAGDAATDKLFQTQNNSGTLTSSITRDGDISAHTLTGIGTAPTVSSGTIGTGARNLAGFITSTTTGAYTGVLTFSGLTAPVGWACAVSNNTTANLIRQTAYTTTTATFAGTTVSGDVLTYNCIAF